MIVWVVQSEVRYEGRTVRGICTTSAMANTWAYLLWAESVDNVDAITVTPWDADHLALKDPKDEPKPTLTLRQPQRPAEPVEPMELPSEDRETFTRQDDGTIKRERPT